MHIDRLAAAGRSVLLPFVAGAAISSAHAIPATYFVEFSGSAPLPAIGVFTYDDQLPRFSNFFVSWGGVLFDLTSAANAPAIGGACSGATSSPATGFALLQHDLCDGVFHRWFGNQNAVSSTFAFYNETLALPAQTGATILANGPGGGDLFPVLAGGDWALSNASSGGFNYIVNFTGSSPLPVLGIFNYDAAARQFGTFTVAWNGQLFDLTASANAPIVGGGCAGATSTPATGFALMDHSLCDGVFSRWYGNDFGASSTFAFYNETLALPAFTGASISATGPGSGDPFPVFAGGEWTLTATTPIPEPSTVPMLLVGGLFIARRLARQVAERGGDQLGLAARAQTKRSSASPWA